MDSPTQGASRAPLHGRGLPRRKQQHVITSYRDGSPRSTRPDPRDEAELPLPTGPADVWLSDATVISAALDPEDWPAWTDEVVLGISRRMGGDA